MCVEQAHQLQHVNVAAVEEVLLVVAARDGAARVAEVAAEDLLAFQEVVNGAERIATHLV